MNTNEENFNDDRPMLSPAAQERLLIQLAQRLTERWNELLRALRERGIEGDEWKGQ